MVYFKERDPQSGLPIWLYDDKEQEMAKDEKNTETGEKLLTKIESDKETYFEVNKITGPVEKTRKKKVAEEIKEEVTE